MQNGEIKSVVAGGTLVYIYNFHGILFLVYGGVFPPGKRQIDAQCWAIITSSCPDPTTPTLVKCVTTRLLARGRVHAHVTIIVSSISTKQWAIPVTRLPRTRLPLALGVSPHFFRVNDDRYHQRRCLSPGSVRTIIRKKKKGGKKKEEHFSITLPCRERKNWSNVSKRINNSSIWKYLVLLRVRSILVNRTIFNAQN